MEKIFIENRIYRDIEECETWEAVIEAIDNGLEPFKKLFFREITTDDIVRLTEIKIKRISKFDTFKADEYIQQLEKDIEEVKHHLEHLVAYAVDYYKRLRDKYGKGRERKTELSSFDQVEIKQVAANNEKLYVNRTEGFIGYGKDLRKEEFVMDCSDIDDVIVYLKNGIYKVVSINDKIFVGKDIIYLNIWNKGDERMTYNAIYLDGKSGTTYAKRFNVTGVTRDKEYNITKGTPRSKLLYFSANPNGEAEIVSIQLSQGCSAKKKTFEFGFSDIAIKGKTSQGNQVTKYPVRKVEQKSVGVSTLGGLDIYMDEEVGRLNKDKRGTFLGNFIGDDKILVVLKTGEYMLTNIELTNRYELKDILILVKFNPKKPLSVIHYYPSKKCYYVKRFLIETTTLDQKYSFIADESGAELTFVTLAKNPLVKYTLDLGKKQTSEEEVSLSELIDVKGWKAIGNKLVAGKIKEVVLIPPPEGEEEEDEVDDDNDPSDGNDGGGENISHSEEEGDNVPKHKIELDITNYPKGEQGSLF